MGSVPAPSSSITHRVARLVSFMMPMMLVMWALKVDRLCSMLCSSPMSTSTRRNTLSLLLSAAGIIRPHIAIRVSRPSVLRQTVLPPVLGPVMTSVS